MHDTRQQAEIIINFGCDMTYRCLGLGCVAAGDGTLECLYVLTGTEQLYDASLDSSTCINTPLLFKAVHSLCIPSKPILV